MAFVLALAEQDSQLDGTPQKKSQPVKRILHSYIVCIKSYPQVIHFIRKNWWITPFRKLAENGIMWWGEVGESGEFQSLEVGREKVGKGTQGAGEHLACLPTKGPPQKLVVRRKRLSLCF